MHGQNHIRFVIYMSLLFLVTHRDVLHSVR